MMQKTNKQNKTKQKTYNRTTTIKNLKENIQLYYEMLNLKIKYAALLFKIKTHSHQLAVSKNLVQKGSLQRKFLKGTELREWLF